MAEERMRRRLAAILAADVVEYARLMSADEEGTLSRLKALRREVIDPAIAEHRGRLVKLTGDGALVEFGSAIDAVRCAAAVQESVADQMRDEPAAQRIAFRIGINLGDVIVDGEDLYGEGVNVAARLEALCEPGGALISGSVYDQVLGRAPYDFEALGERQVKNIDRPVRVYRLAPPASAERAAHDETGAPQPERASIAVLPFANLSGDPEQEYFADGITEDVITELTRFPDLIVIARNSTFVYKGRAVKIQDVGRELGVRFVIEGSVRRSGDRVRVTIQLIDAATSNHVWAERYDRELVDLFALQDELTQAIVAVLPGRVEMAVGARIRRKPLSDMAAYDCLLAGKIHHHRSTREDNATALAMLERAISLEPELGQAWAWKACALGQALSWGWMSEERCLPMALEALDRALAVDADDVECHRLLCEVNMELHRDWDKAVLHHETAFRLNPNDVRLVAQKGELLTWLGRAEEALPWLEKAMRLDPFEAHRRAHLLGRALYAARRYAEAASAYKCIRIWRYSHCADLAACHAQLSDWAEAERQKAETLRLKPEFSIVGYLEGLLYRSARDREHHREGLLKAGLPE